MSLASHKHSFWLKGLSWHYGVKARDILPLDSLQTSGLVDHTKKPDLPWRLALLVHELWLDWNWRAGGEWIGYFLRQDNKGLAQFSSTPIALSSQRPFHNLGALMDLLTVCLDFHKIFKNIFHSPPPLLPSSLLLPPPPFFLLSPFSSSSSFYLIIFVSEDIF